MPGPTEKAKIDTAKASAGKESAAPASAAPEAARVADLLAMLEDPQVQSYLETRFAPLEDHNKLQEDHSKLQEGHSKLQEGHSKLQEDHNELKARVDHMTGVFEPATEYALFETFIYEFVESAFPSQLEEGKKEKAKHAMATLCSDVLVRLLKLCDDNKLRCPFTLNEFSGRRNRHFRREDWKPSVLRALQGLEQYIAIVAEKEALSKWTITSGKRNGVVHNGDFLDAIFGPFRGTGSSNATRFAETKEKINNYRNELEQKSAGVCPYTNLYDAVEAVVNQLQSKGLSVEDAMKTGVVGKLQELVGDSGTA